MTDLDVPDGWTRTTLGALGRYLNGRAFKSSEWSRKGRPIIRIQDLSGSNRNPNYFEGEVEDRYVVRTGDFLISWSATLGAYIWDGPEGVLNQHIFKVESKVNKRFHYHLVRERIAELERNAHGSGMVHVTKGVFESTPVAIPNEPETQSAIADLIDRLESKQRSAGHHVAMARRAVERFRQAVFAAACSGRLTAAWRDDHPNEPKVSDILEVDRKSLSPKRSRALAAFTSADLPELPSTWEWVPLGAVSKSVLGKMLDKLKNRGDPHPYLRNINVRWRRFDLSNVQEMRFREGEEERFGLQAGDVLVCEGGDPGRAAVWRDVGSDMRFQKALHRVRCDDVLLPDWLVNVLEAHALSGLLAPYFTGSGIAHLTGVSLARVPIPLPPPNEQVELVKRVGELLVLQGRVSNRLELISRLIESTSPAMLAKAFRGELSLPDLSHEFGDLAQAE